MAVLTYDELLREASPEMIETKEQYRAVSSHLAELVRKARNRSNEETRLMKLLGVLVRDYDQRHALPAIEMTPHEALRFLMEQTGKEPADVLPVFGQRSHVNEALNGKRPISADQARKLAKIFSVKAGFFV